MDSEQISAILNEVQFPGNEAAFAELRQILALERPIGFTGAGTSAPEIPTWGGVLHELLFKGRNQGLITEADGSEILDLIDQDPLEAASHLEDAFTPTKFRTILSATFDKNDLCTNSHELLLNLGVSGFVTLNYDPGLSNAFVKKFKILPKVIRSSDAYEIAKWAQSENNDIRLPSIVHWHGVPSSPEDMVFTGNDYNKFYAHRQNISFIQELFKTRRILCVGFGFKDPFFTRVLEDTLRDYASDDRHFAIIGRPDGNPVSTLSRKTFSRKYKIRPLFYSIHIDSQGKEDHSDLSALLCAIGTDSHGIGSPDSSYPDKITVATPSRSAETVQEKRHEYENNLFVSPLGTQLYVDPRLYRPAALDDEQEDSSRYEVKFDEIIQSGKSYVISAPHEYGLTTLGRRILHDLQSLGFEAFYRDAHQIPNYRKKLEQDIIFSAAVEKANRAIIIDGLDFETHERMLKEVIGLNCFERIFILTKSAGPSSRVDDFNFGENFEVLYLSNLHRHDIRELAIQMYKSEDSDLISGVVDKVYGDLLELCIPLTPANVVMYLAIVYKEGDFLPLSRLQIIDRYVRDLLRRPSDSYRDSFNVDNKLDVASAFVYEIYSKNKVSFSEVDWTNFCKNYMEKSLISFDSDSLLMDLSSSRFLYKSSSAFFFKYKLFYSYFLGRFVAKRPSDLQNFLKTNAHLKVEGIVEIISGMSSDNTVLIEDLTLKLEAANERFYEQYKISHVDPHAEIEWTYSEEEEIELWKPVTDSLAAGPADTTEIDTLKRSISAEKRTEQQAVIIRDFSSLEKSVTHNQSELITAVNNAIDIDGRLKVRAVTAIFEAYKAALQVGMVFAPVIASQKYFLWSSFAFVNKMDYDQHGIDSDHRKTLAVVSALPRAVIERAVEEMGSKKLSEVFSYMASKGELKGFEKFLNYSLILRSKPKSWNKIADLIITSTDRKALYLRYMLGAAMRQFRQDVNTNHERSLLKSTIAKIRAKRQFNKVDPGAKAVSRMLRALERDNYFSSDN